MIQLWAASEAAPSPFKSDRNVHCGRRSPLYRWHVEECFQQAENEAGLDHYQVRTWRAWYAHITLSMLALAWLAASRARAVKGNRRRRPGHDRLHGSENPPPDPASSPQWAFNQALRNLGVDRGAAFDEFDALNLGRHRHTENWQTTARS
jgi:hypothetical protein